MKSIRLYTSVIAVCAAGMAILAHPRSALAQPTVSNPFAVRLQNSVNAGNYATGDILYWGAESVTPSTSPPSYGFTYQCPSGATCPPFFQRNSSFVAQSLYHHPWTLAPDQWSASRPYDSSLLGPWNLEVSSTSNFAPGSNAIVQTPSVGGVGSMPYVSSMTVQGSGLTPTISWVLPSSPSVPIDNQRVIVFDNTNQVTAQSVNPNFVNSFQQSDPFYTSGALGGTTTFTIPDGVLQYGHSYSVAIQLANLRGGATFVPGCFSCSMDSESNSFFDFSPIDSQSLNISGEVYLPTVQPIPTSSGLVSDVLYHFNVPSVGTPGTTTYIDPLVATGYIYTKGPNDPNFATVDPITDVGNGIYALSVWDGSQWILVDPGLMHGTVFDFTTLNGYSGGVSQFEITGIDPGLSPTDITAFVTGLTFVSDGTFTGTMEPIVSEVTVPEPGTIALLGIGLAGLGWGRRRRAR
jgi:hypothetical protein